MSARFTGLSSTASTEAGRRSLPAAGPAGASSPSPAGAAAPSSAADSRAGAGASSAPRTFSGLRGFASTVTFGESSSSRRRTFSSMVLTAMMTFCTPAVFMELKVVSSRLKSKPAGWPMTM